MAPVCVVAAAGTEAWLAVAVDSDAAWRALCGRLSDAALSPGWSLAERQANADLIEAAIGRWAAGHSPAEAAERLQAFGVPAAPVHPADTLWRNEHLCAVNYWVRLQRRYIGEHLVPHPPIRFNGARLKVERPAPVVGEHNREALAELEMA
jgi:benzylsuccinate CoA-transferase BbsF subunit